MIHCFFRVRVLGVIGLIGGIGVTEAAPSTWAKTGGTVPSAGFVVDLSNRLEVLSFHNTVYKASEGTEGSIGWTSSYGTCVPGTTSLEFQDHVRRRVNYYRALCGLPADITFNLEPALNDGPAGIPKIPGTTGKHACAQAAASMNAFSNVVMDNFKLTHNPTSASVTCYSSIGANGAFFSNLTIGYFGPRAMDAYIADDNLSDDQSNNSNVGHRRWMLFSRARDMATGDVPPGSFSYLGTPYPVLPANALYISGLFKPVETAPKQFITWPSGGYVPIQHKPLRWSISYPGAVFPGTASAIKMTGPGGVVIPVTVLSFNDTTVGDNTLVFQPQQTTVTGAADAAFTVTVTGMSGPGVPPTYTWQTTFFDPSVLGFTQTITGPLQPSAAGADYQFTPVPFVSDYQLQVNAAPAAAATYTENGDAATPEITTNKTGSYPILQGAGVLNAITFTPRSGTKSFHLCFPLDESEPDYLPHEQSFSLGPEFVPAASSTIAFQELFRWLFTVNRLSLEISTDGSLWNEIYGRNGAYTYVANDLHVYNNSLWDTSWKARSVSLAAWAGKPVRLRFVLRHGNTSFDGADLFHGCYLDDIVLTGVSRLSAGRATAVTAPAFRLDSQTAGAPLTAGASYLLRVRPLVGSAYLGYAPGLTVVAKPPTGFESTHPTLAAHPLGDADQDGISNVVEYGFGLNPSAPNTADGLPQPVWGASDLTLGFTIPLGVTDLTYTAECTADFINWQPVANQGTGTQCRFTVPVTPGQNCFMRLKVGF